MLDRGVCWVGYVIKWIFYFLIFMMIGCVFLGVLLGYWGVLEVYEMFKGVVDVCWV